MWVRRLPPSRHSRNTKRILPSKEGTSDLGERYSFSPSLDFPKPSRNQRNRVMPDWSLLPSSLIDEVAGLLPVEDQARMSAACKSWREAMADGLCRRHPVPSIWIIICDGVMNPFDNGINEFASFSGGMRRSYFLSMPFKKASIVGSSRGWIMLQNEYKRLRAFHPISRTDIPFPATNMHIKKIVFVPQRQGRRGAGKKPAVAIILQHGLNNEEGELSFACAGDKVWTVLPMPGDIRVEDIVAYEGKLYALGNENQVVIFDLDEELSSSTLEMVHASGRARRPNEYLRIGVMSGELFVVRCWTAMASSPRPVTRFEVSLLLNDAESQWRWVTTTNLSGHAILRDSRGVIALPVRHHEELQAGCIYYIDGVDGTVSLMKINLKGGQGCLKICQRMERKEKESDQGDMRSLVLWKDERRKTSNFWL